MHSTPATMPWAAHRGPDAYYRDLRNELKHVSGDELLAVLEAAGMEVVTAEERHADIDDADLREQGIAFDLIVSATRYRAAEDELALRLRAVPDGPSFAADPRTREWTERVRAVRERANCADLLMAFGYPLRKVGRDSRRDGHEWAGACPVCGGNDRLRVFDGHHGLAWCRRCGWRADAITIARSYGPCGPGFRDAVRYLTDIVSSTHPRKELP